MKLSTNEKLQDLYYYYDPVGNITRIKDDAQQTLFYSNSMISPDLNYVYDGLYRLIVASGRERIPQYGASPGNNWNDGPRVQHASMQWDGTRLQTYIDAYFYDDVGNRTFVAHQAGVDGGYSTVFSHTGNRLDVTYVVNDSTFYYNYDSRGNLVSLPHIPVMTYNRQNELWYAQVNDGMYNQYSGGQRIRKTVLKTGGIREERIYLGSYELYRKYDSTGAIDIERSTVHVSDDTGRIAMREALNTSYNSDGSDALLTRYIYSNHLGSASLELSATGQIISYEEYHPYGTTAYQMKNADINATAKRYRYTGKERDEETGLYYHGARYYIPWLARWCAVDPLESKYSPQSAYNYGNSNPVTWNDPTGMGGEDKTTSKPYTPEGGAGTKSGYMETSTQDGKLTGNPVNTELKEVVVTGKATTWNKVKSFAIGFAEGALITAAVIALVTVTGGLGFIGVAAGISSIAAGAGAASLVLAGVKLSEGNMSTLEKYELAGGIAGGLVEGGLSSPTGLFKGELNPNLEIAATETQVPTFAEPTTTETPTFSEPTTTGTPTFETPLQGDGPSSRIAAHRASIKGKSPGNYGYIEGEINGKAVSNEIVRSGSADENIPEIFDALKINKQQVVNGEKSWLRTTDSEYKLLKRLANTLGGEKGNVYPNVKGKLTLVSEREFCESCQGVIQQFQEMFPNITLNFVNGTKY